MILDIVGAPYLQKNCEAVAQDGRIVLIGWMGGMTVKDWDMMPMVKKRISLIGARTVGFPSPIIAVFCFMTRSLQGRCCRSCLLMVSRFPELLPCCVSFPPLG